MKQEDFAQFSTSLRGPVIDRGNPGYDEARSLYNGMIDKHPLLHRAMRGLW